MASKFPQMIELAQRMASRFGTRVKVQTPSNTITGQPDDPVFETYEIDVVFKVNYTTRQTDYIRMDYLRMLFPATKYREPRAGDVVTTPNGRKYIVETVSAVKPDGFPVVYDVSVRDG